MTRLVPPWPEYQLELMLWDHLTSAGANFARRILENGILVYGPGEIDALGSMLDVDVIIKVGPEDNPETKRGTSKRWGTDGDEIRTRTRSALKAIFAGQVRSRLRSLLFEEAPSSELTALVRARAMLCDRDASNQANVHPASPATIEEAGLRFRSWSEVLLWRAFMRHLQPGESVAPLPVVCTAPFVRLEPDFLVFTKHRLLLVEVDGPCHDETLAEARSRTAVLEASGFVVYRVEASKMHSPEKVEKWVEDLLRSAREATPVVTA